MLDGIYAYFSVKICSQGLNSKLETRNSKLYARADGAVAQFGRAPRSQCGGQGFDPPLLHQLTSSLSITYKRHSNKHQKSFDVRLTALRRTVFAICGSVLGQSEKSLMKMMIADQM